MYVTEEVAKDHLESEKNFVNRLRVKKLYNGGRDGSLNFPDPIRILAGTLSHVSKNKDVAEALGMSKQQVSNIKNGKTNENVKSAIDRNLGTVQDRALELTMKSLGLIEEEKLEKSKPRELIAIARDAASIYEKVSPKEKNNVQVGVQVVLHSVPQRNEENYETVEVNNEDDRS